MVKQVNTWRLVSVGNDLCQGLDIACRRGLQPHQLLPPSSGVEGCCCEHLGIFHALALGEAWRRWKSPLHLRCLIDEHSHTRHQVMRHVAVQVPPAWVVCAEAKHNVATWRNNDGIFSDCTIEIQCWRRAVLPISLSKACAIATLNIIGLQARGMRRS